MKKLPLLLLFIPLVSCKNVEVRKTYYDSGELKSTVNYVDGVMEGEYYWYWESGGLEGIGYFVDGVEQSPYEPN